MSVFVALGVTFCVMVTAGGCAAGAAGANNGVTASSGTPLTVHSTATRPAPSGRGSQGPGTPSTGAGCHQTPMPALEAGSLSGLQFVSGTQGWAVGQD